MNAALKQYSDDMPKEQGEKNMFTTLSQDLRYYTRGQYRRECYRRNKEKEEVAKGAIDRLVKDISLKS